MTGGGISKVYFTRTRLQQKEREQGEEKIEQVFANLGYKIVAPEQIDAMEQIWLLAHCKSFAATYGTVSHNALFCRPGTEVVILRKSHYVNEYQLIIDEITGVNAVYVDAHRSHRNAKFGGPFYMCVTSELKRFAKDRGLSVRKECRWLSMPYIRYWTRQNIYNPVWGTIKWRWNYYKGLLAERMKKK